MLWCIVFAMNAQCMSCRACLLLPYLRLLLIYQFTYCLASQPFIKALIFNASLGRIRSLIIGGFHHFRCLNFKFSLFLILITLRPKRKQKWVTFSLSCIVKLNYIVTLNCFYFLVLFICHWLKAAHQINIVRLEVSMFGLWLYFFFRNLQ